jgi:type II secretory pathway component PulJ
MMTMRARRRGFSTAEVLVASTISLIGFAALYSIFFAQQKALRTQAAYADVQTTTRSVLDLMAREIRMASYDPTGAALPVAPGPACPGVRRGLADATPTRVRFQQDLNGDGALTGSNEDLTYELVGSDLRRTDGDGAPVVLASGLPSGGFVLRYFTGGNPSVELVPTGSPAALTASQRDCVARVRLTLQAVLPNPNPNDPRPLASQVSSEVAIRSRALGSL